MENMEEEIIYSPNIVKVSKNLYRTTISETEEIFTGNLDDTLGVIHDNYMPNTFDIFDFLKNTCENLEFKKFLRACQKGNTTMNIFADGNGKILFYSNKKVFICSLEDSEKVLKQIYNATSRYSPLKKYNKSSTIKWEKRANNIKDNDLLMKNFLDNLK